MKRIPLIAALVLMPLVNATAEEADFTGVWVGRLCPEGVERGSGKCSSFVLELHQKDGRVCGAHFFANGDASEVDEGAAPSIFGNVEDASARVVAVSSRPSPPIRVPAEITKSKGTLRWKLLDEPSGDYLLPKTSRLTKSRSKTLFAPVFAQELSAACASAFYMASQREAQPPVPPDSSSPGGAVGATASGLR